MLDNSILYQKWKSRTVNMYALTVYDMHILIAVRTEDTVYSDNICLVPKIIKLV